MEYGHDDSLDSMRLYFQGMSFLELAILDVMHLDTFRGPCNQCSRSMPEIESVVGLMDIRQGWSCPEQSSLHDYVPKQRPTSN